jgi:hypothetical protein
MIRFENVGVFIREKVWLENSLSHRNDSDKVRAGPSTETGCGVLTAHVEAMGVYVKEIRRVSG